MKRQKPKATRTVEYMRGTNRERGFDGARALACPTFEIPPGTEYCRKGAWSCTPKREYDAGELADSLAQAEDRVLFFLDTSLFDTETDPRIWEALLGHRRKLALTPEVRRELRPWIEKHPNHIAAEAVTGNAAAFIEHVGVDLKHETTVALCEYYVNLLGFRKTAFGLLDEEFKAKHGRAPNADEQRVLRTEANNKPGFGPRAHLLAKKGEQDAGSPNFYTDEILVTLAAIWGLERQREVIVLTKDEDLQEQHYKLMYLMDTHYRGMLLAERFGRDPRGFVSYPFPADSPVLADAFEPCEGTLIERADSLAEDLLPADTFPVPLHCWVVGRTASMLTFGADSGMHRLLPIKGRTKGLNTELFDGRNCHFWLAPLPFPEGARERKCAAIGRDRLIQAGGKQFSLLDLNQAVASIERFTHLHLNEPEIAEV